MTDKEKINKALKALCKECYLKSGCFTSKCPKETVTTDELLNIYRLEYGDPEPEPEQEP